MKFVSLQPFVPSGADFASSKALFIDLGFDVSWDMGDYVGFDRDGCRSILQKLADRAFAENFMISVGVTNVNEFRDYVLEKGLTEKYGIRVGEVSTSS
jgi:hypothetical protein